MSPSMLFLAAAATAAALTVIEEPVIVDSPPLFSDTQSRRLDVPCPGCPLSSNARVPNHLQFSFEVEHPDSAPDRLLLNGFELFPNPMWGGALAAVQVRDDEPSELSHDRYDTGPHEVLRDLGYSLAVRPVAADDDPAELLEISLRIVEVGPVVVDRVPLIVARIVSLAGGTLLIAKADTHDPPPPLPSGAPTCSLPFCELHRLVAQHLAGLGTVIKHCGGTGHRPSGPNNSPGDNSPGAPYHDRHSWRHLVRNIVSHIVLPMLIGVVAGVSASIIGMLVGTFAVCLWRVVVLKRSAFPRRARPATSCVAAPEKAALAAREHQDLEREIGRLLTPPLLNPDSTYETNT